MVQKPPPLPHRTDAERAGAPRSATARVDRRPLPADATAPLPVPLHAERPAPVSIPGAPPVRSAPQPPPPPEDDTGATRVVSPGNLAEASLLVTGGPHDGKRVELGAGTCVIGRSSECDLPLKGVDGVSRRHCKIQFLGGQFVCMDLESRNGTLINGVPATRRALQPGDRVQLGDAVLVFVMETLADRRGGSALDSMEGTATVPAQPSHTPPLPVGPPRRVSSAAETTGLPTLPPTHPAPGAASSPSSLSSGRPQASSVPPPLPAAARGESAGRDGQSARGGRRLLIFAGLSAVVVAGAGFLVWDLFWREAADGGAADLALVSQGGPSSPPLPSPTAPSPVPAPGEPSPVAAPAEPSPSPSPSPVASLSPAPEPETPPTPSAASAAAAEGALHVVRAPGDGRATKIAARPGERVAAGAVLLVVEANNPALIRKLATLKQEEEQFEAAVGRDAAMREELASVRREIAGLEKRLEPRPVTADRAGEVVEVFVKPGDVVRLRAPVVTLR